MALMYLPTFYLPPQSMATPVKLRNGALYLLEHKPGLYRCVGMDGPYAKMKDGNTEFLIWPGHVKLAAKELVEAYVQGVRYGRANPKD